MESIGYINSVIHLIPIHTALTPVGKLEYTVQDLFKIPYQ